MPSFVTLDSICAAAPDGRHLFDNLSLALGRERTGLVGRNGAGKSTLLRIISGELEPASGAVVRAGSIGVLEQTLDPRLSVAQALGVEEGAAVLARLEAGHGSANDAEKADWTLPTRTEDALEEVGLRGLGLDRRVESLSGGERTRLALARLAIASPDMLLLDEPTNNLDARGRGDIVAFLNRWRGGVVIASHDRSLLEHVDRIVELSPVGAWVFGGAWSAFAEAREAAHLRAVGEVERARRALSLTERESQAARERQDRRDKAGRAKRAKGDAPKMLLDAKAERAEHSAARGSRLADRLIGESAAAFDVARSRLEVLTPLSIELPRSGLPSGRLLLAFDGVVAEHGRRRLFGPLSFDVRGPERIALKGDNGSGKSTLLRLATGRASPAAGAVRRLTDRFALLDQHVSLLDPRQSILENLRRLHPAVTEREARAALARFAFRNTAATRTVATLSGGERMRAGLACVFAAREAPELLLLDEPTNHLDIASTEILERALADYDGALMVVSHDERFLEGAGIQRTIVL